MNINKIANIVCTIAGGMVVTAVAVVVLSQPNPTYRKCVQTRTIEWNTSAPDARAWKKQIKSDCPNCNVGKGDYIKATCLR